MTRLSQCAQRMAHQRGPVAPYPAGPRSVRGACLAAVCQCGAVKTSIRLLGSPAILRDGALGARSEGPEDVRKRALSRGGGKPRSRDALEPSGRRGRRDAGRAHARASGAP
jgi:hypothetical protein